MNIWRMIVGTTIRAVIFRIVAVIFAAVIAMAGTGKAHAASAYSCPATLVPKCDQGAALSAASARQGDCPTGTTNGALVRVQHSPNGNSGSYIPYFKCMNGATVWYEEFQGFNQFYGSTCQSRPNVVAATPPWPTVGSGLAFQSGSLDCSNGCVRTSSQLEDGAWASVFGGATCTVESLAQQCQALGMVAVFYGCQPPKPECKSDQSKDPKTGKCTDVCPKGMHADETGACVKDGDSCPAGQIRSPAGTCLPGDGQCAAGEARRPNGTCGKDADGDGVADDDDEDPDNDSEKETFSGGNNCNNPPSCSGGPIMCGMARIQWRIDCNTRKNVNISGGACNAVPICTGEKCNAMEYSQLLHTWKAGCELEKLNAKTGTGTGGGQPDWTKVTGDGTAGAGEDPDKPHRTVGLGISMIDDSGIFGGGSCPMLGTLELGEWGSFNLDQYDWVCKLFAAIKLTNILLGAYLAFQILSGRFI